MKRVVYAFAALAFALSAFVLSGTKADAAPATPVTATSQVIGADIVHQVQARCFFVNAQCRARFGGGPDYRRCMRRRACGFGGGYDRPRRCNFVERECRRDYGRGPDFRRCMRRRGC